MLGHRRFSSAALMSARSESRRASRSGTTLQSGKSRSASSSASNRDCSSSVRFSMPAQPLVVVLHRLHGHRIRRADAEDRAHEELMHEHRPRLDADGLEQRRIVRRRAFHQEQLARACLLRGERRVGRQDELEVREHVAQEIPELPLPHRMEVQVDLVDEEHPARRERIFVVVEGIGDAEQQVAAPRSHVLIAVAEVRQRHLAVDGVEHQVPALPIDALECHPRQQLAHCLVDDREPFVLAAVVEIDRPRLQRIEHGVGRKERRDVVRAPMAEARGSGLRGQLGAAQPARRAVRDDEIVACRRSRWHGRAARASLCWPRRPP